MSNEIALSIVGLTKSYGRVQALRGVDLDVKKGENGGFSGAKRRRQDHDHPLPAGSDPAPKWLRCGVLGFDPQKDPVLRAQASGLSSRRAKPGDQHAASRPPCATSATCGTLCVIGTTQSSLPTGCSSTSPCPSRTCPRAIGQKVGVVQALMPRPELLLLDEPTSGLDPLMQQEVYRLLREARAEGATVFFSSHIIGEVEAIADRVAIIRQGVVVEEAKPSDLARLSLRRVRIRLREPSDLTPLSALPGVSIVSQRSDTHLTLQVEGDMDQLIKALSHLPVTDLQTDNPSLEEVFLTFYQDSVL